MSQSFSLNKKEKELCIQLSRDSIKYYLETNSLPEIKNFNYLKKIPAKLKENKACFVTLMINKNLRGCIGHLESFQPLYKDIIQNSIASAFSDTRFPQLIEAEFSLIKIEVSILTDPIPLPYKNPKDLIKKIRAGKDGLIIEKGTHGATFLPSVWEDIKKKEDFLFELCKKANLPFDEWTRGTLNVKRYETIKIKEK